MRNWQIKVWIILRLHIEDTAKIAKRDRKKTQSTRTNEIKRKYFLVSFISYFSAPFLDIVLRKIFFRLPFLDVFLCAVYRIVTSCFYFRFLFAWPLLVFFFTSEAFYSTFFAISSRRSTLCFFFSFLCFAMLQT